MTLLISVEVWLLLSGSNFSRVDTPPVHTSTLVGHRFEPHNWRMMFYSSLSNNSVSSKLFLYMARSTVDIKPPTRNKTFSSPNHAVPICYLKFPCQVQKPCSVSVTHALTSGMRRRGALFLSSYRWTTR